MLSRFKSVLANRSFRYLVSSSTVTTLGDRLTHMLLITLIALSQPGKVLAYSEGALVFALPPILFSPVVGVLIDRWDKRRILAGVHFAQGALLALAPLLILVTRSLLPVWFIIFLFFVVDVFNNTTSPAILPAIVGPSEIVAANSAASVFARFAAIIGMVAGGFIVKSLGWKLSFGLNAATHVIAAFLVLGVAPSRLFRPSTAAPRTELPAAMRRSVGSFLEQLRAVIRLVGRNRAVAFVIFSIVVSMAISGIAYSVLLFLIQQVLKLGTSGVGIYTGILAAGMILGALSLGAAGRDTKHETLNSKTGLGFRISGLGFLPRVIVFGIAITGTLFLAGPWLMNRWFLGIVALLSGVTFSWIGIAQTSILQTRVGLEIQGRIFATREFFSNVTLILTTFGIGLISLVTALKSLLLVVGAALLVIAGFGLWLARRLEQQ